MRVGCGYDIHRLVPGRKLILGGVTIPFEKGLLGHSDADVLLHALCDALLGAASLGDIGQHFPDTEPRFRNVSSMKLLARTLQMVHEKGFVVHNVDAAVLAESPRLGPYREAMRNQMANALAVNPDRVNIKAKTNEGLGAVGRGEAIAATCVVTLEEGSPAQ